MMIPIPGYHGGNFTRMIIAPAELEALELAASCIPPGTLILEIGSFEGASTICLARGARCSHSKLVSIDWGKGSLSEPEREWGDSDYVPKYEMNLKLFEVEDMVETIREDSRIVARTWNRSIGFLFVDGDHTYEGCLSDLQGFTPYLAHGGIVALHDHQPAFPGVMRAVQEVFPHQFEWCIKQVNGLLLLRYWK